MKKWSTEYYIAVITAAVAFFAANFAFLFAPAYEKNIKSGFAAVMLVVVIYILIRKKK